MKRWYLSAGLLLCLSSFGVAQDANQSGGITSDRPAGTKIVGHDHDTIVKPQRKPVKVDSKVVKAAQQALAERGYDPGPADGVLGPTTEAALNKFQADEKIDQTGQLDTNTLSKLNVGGTRIVGSAPADLGRGGKAAAHNAAGGHPVEAGKAAGSGAATFGKKVAKGTKALAVEGVEKAGKGISAVGNKITGKAQGTDNDKEDKEKTPSPDDHPPAAAGDNQNPPQ
jgi:peptidoglycan hydrolase-like protein with peptidoglycan-binding domain